MPLKIVRNDITKMNTEAIVNTANADVAVGAGCDIAVYKAAGYDVLLKYRKDNIGYVAEGQAFITPGFNLEARYIIHAVSPLYLDGDSGEEEKLRLCYRNSLKLAKDNSLKSISFPLISTGSFGYPKEEGMRIAVDEINAFLLHNEMDIYLVAFDNKSTELGEKIYSKLDAYIDENYVLEKRQEEYVESNFEPLFNSDSVNASYQMNRGPIEPQFLRAKAFMSAVPVAPLKESACESEADEDFAEDYSYDKHDENLKNRIQHMSDTFSEYLLFLIAEKGMTNADVYKRAIVDKKVFSKIKNNPDYHPQKITAMCLCVGARLNLDETKDLLARAGYALSPCDITDVIFSYFIENEIYDMIELDIQLEEHGQKCLIS